VRTSVIFAEKLPLAMIPAKRMRAACHDPSEADALLAKARNRLDDIQKLLGTH
jgi:hypothetical protein